MNEYPSYIDFSRPRPVRDVDLLAALVIGNTLCVVLVVTLTGPWRLLGLLGILPVLAATGWRWLDARRTTAALAARINQHPGVGVEVHNEPRPVWTEPRP